MKISKNNQSNQNGMSALKMVMAFVLLLCSLTAGFAIELIIAGTNILYWSFAERGMWLLIWTVIIYVVLYLFSKDAFNTKMDNEATEEDN